MSNELDIKSYWVAKTANDAILGKQVRDKVNLDNWKAGAPTLQTKAAENYNRRCRIGKQTHSSSSRYFFPDFGEDDA